MITFHNQPLSCPVRLENLSHRRERPLAPTPIEQWLRTGNCRSPCCVDAEGEVGVSSPGVGRCMLVCGVVGCKPGQCNMEDRCCPCSMTPLSTSLMEPKERQGRYSLGPVPSQELSERVEYNGELPWGLQLRLFPQGLLLKPFPWLGMAARQRRFKIRVFLPLGVLPS